MRPHVACMVSMDSEPKPPCKEACPHVNSDLLDTEAGASARRHCSHAGGLAYRQRTEPFPLLHRLRLRSSPRSAIGWTTWCGAHGMSTKTQREGGHHRRRLCAQQGALRQPPPGPPRAARGSSPRMKPAPGITSTPSSSSSSAGQHRRHTTPSIGKLCAAMASTGTNIHNASAEQEEAFCSA